MRSSAFARWNWTSLKVRQTSAFKLAKLSSRLRTVPKGKNRSSGAILGEKAMRATLEWRAARLRDEIKRLRDMELDVLEGERTSAFRVAKPS